MPSYHGVRSFRKASWFQCYRSNKLSSLRLRMKDQVRHLNNIGGPAIQRGQQTHTAGHTKRQLRARLWLS